MTTDAIHIYPSDTAYPAALTALTPAPELWVRGRVVPDDTLAVAIVGARRATTYGIEVAARLASELAARGVTIVSGFARGIDTAAHRGALEAGGRTIAVLGAGIDVLYPPENVALAREVGASGALLTNSSPERRRCRTIFRPAIARWPRSRWPWWWWRRRSGAAA